MRLGDEIAAAYPIFPAVTEIEAVIELHFQPVRAGGVGDADLLDPDDGARIAGWRQAAAILDHAFQRPAVAADGGAVVREGGQLAACDVVGAQEIGGIEAVGIGIDFEWRALLDDPAIPQQQDMVGGDQDFGLVMRDEDGADL